MGEIDVPLTRQDESPQASRTPGERGTAAEFLARLFVGGEPINMKGEKRCLLVRSRREKEEGSEFVPFRGACREKEAASTATRDDTDCWNRFTLSKDAGGVGVLEGGIEAARVLPQGKKN